MVKRLAKGSPLNRCFVEAMAGGGHWKVQDVKAEVETLQALLVARPNLAKRQDLWLQQLKAKLQSLQELSSPEMLELYDVFSKSGLPEEFVKGCHEALDSRAMAGAGSSATALVNKAQSCDGLHRYLTESELGVLAARDMWSSCAVLARRLKLLGLTNLKESTKKAGVAVLVYFEWKRTQLLPFGDTTYVLAEHLRAAFERCAVQPPAGVPRLASLPADPADLDQDHLLASYGDSEKPCRKEIPELAQIHKNNAWVRGSSKQVRKGKGAATRLN